VTANDSQRKPLDDDPSSSTTVPIASGEGMAATNDPKPSVGSRHTSVSMAAPSSDDRTRPGLGGSVGRA
jgi:hypothetical protein